MAPHPNSFIIHRSIFVPNLVLLSQSAQFGQILGLSSPTTTEECLIYGISASREQSKHIKLYVLQTAVAAASATDRNAAEQSIIDETMEFSLIEFASVCINHTVRVERNYITAHAEWCREDS